MKTAFIPEFKFQTTHPASSGGIIVENNLMGGVETGPHEKLVQENGKDILSCTADVSSASCKRGQALNNANPGG